MGRLVPRAVLGLTALGLVAQTPPAGDKSLEDQLLALLNTPVESAAKGTKTKASEAPAIVSVVTGDEARSLGCRSVAEALRTVPGLFATDDLVAPNLGVRGIQGGLRGYSRIVKVMINGQPVSFRSDTTNFIGPELIPMEAVERIEVVRGPASSMYGANAFLGVINIITRKPGDPAVKGSLVARSRLGVGERYDAGEAMVNVGSQTWGLLAAASASDTDRSGYTIPGGSPIFLTRPGLAGMPSQGDRSRPRSAFLQGNYFLPSRWVLDLSAHFSRLDSNGEFLDYGTLSHQNRIQVDNQFARLKAEGEITDTFSLATSVAWSKGEPGPDERLNSGDTATHPRRDIGYTGLDGMVEGRLKLGERNSVTLGVDVSSESQQLMTVYTVNNGTGVEVPASGVQGKKTFSNTGTYAQVMLYPLAKLGVTVNARYDKHNIYGSKTTWRAGLVYGLSETMHTKLLYGTSFKAPAAWQLYAQPLFGGEVLGNPSLKPETADTLEMEVGWTPNERMAFTVNAYKNKVKDKVELVAKASNQVPSNLGLQDSLGVEAQGRALFGSHSLTAGLAWQKTDATTPDPFLGGLKVPSSAYPSVTGFFRYQFHLDALSHAGFEVRHASERRATPSNITENLLRPYKLDAITLADLFATYGWKVDNGKVRAQLRVNNLFNKAYAEPGFRGVDVPGRRREVVGSFGFQF